MYTGEGRRGKHQHRKGWQLPLNHSFAFCGFRYPQSTRVQKQMSLLLTDCQNVSSSLTLSHNIRVTPLASSHHVGMLASHLITRVSPLP